MEVDDDEQIEEKPTTSKNKKLNKNKKKNYFEFTKEEKKIIEKLNNEIVPFESNNYANFQSSNKNKKVLNKLELYEISKNNNSKIEGGDMNKEDKNKKRKVSNKQKLTNLKLSSVKNNGVDVTEENKALNNLIISKFENLIIKLNSIYLKNILNKYYQRWLLQTFDIEEEEYSEVQNEDEKNTYQGNIEGKEEEEEEEENDYGGDLEEIEERAADEEESVITSVQSKTKQKRTNDILFALRKIIKYKNVFFRYFIRWFNAVDINAPTNEYKKMRKGKKITNTNLSGKKNSGNLSSSLNNSNNNNLKHPIYEVPLEEKIDDAKANLKNFIELKGNKRNILKKYYDIWYGLTFSHNTISTDSNNEYIFTYHGKYRNNTNIIEPKINKPNLTGENIFERYSNNSDINNNFDYEEEQEIEEFNKKTEIINEGLEQITIKTKQKTQCYVKKKVNSINRENKKDDGDKKKNNKKKDKIINKLKNIFSKINNKKLLYFSFKNWAEKALSQNESVTKVIFKNKQSMKIKKKNVGSRNKTKNQLVKLNHNNNNYNNNENNSKEEKVHKKNNLSIDDLLNQKDKIKKLKTDKKINSFVEEEQLLSESFQIINPTNNKVYNFAVNNYQIFSDNSVNNSIKTNSNSVNEIFEQIKETKENVQKKAKKTKGDGIKKLNKNKEKKISITPPPERNNGYGPELEKIKKMVEKIKRTHRNKVGQRYLLIKPPKIFKKIQEKKKDERESFSSINYSLKFEKFQKNYLN